MYEGLAHLKGSKPTKDVVDMAYVLATTAARVLGIKWGVKVAADEADF